MDFFDFVYDFITIKNIYFFRITVNFKTKTNTYNLNFCAQRTIGQRRVGVEKTTYFYVVLILITKNVKTLILSEYRYKW